MAKLINVSDLKAHLQTPEKRNNPQPTHQIFPKSHRELFNAIPAEENLKLDRQGNRRITYSVRHTYICLRLIEGADIHQIARNCRTSVEMIEKFYALHLKTQLVRAINVMRPANRNLATLRGFRCRLYRRGRAGVAKLVDATDLND